MASLAGNDAYLSVDGVSIGAYAIDFAPKLSSAEIDTTAGFGSDWTKTAPGLKTFKGTLTVTYETASIATILTAINSGSAKRVVYGPEGNTAGKPKHDQDCVFSGVDGPVVKVTKDHSTFKVDITGTGAPYVDMYSGGVF